MARVTIILEDTLVGNLDIQLKSDPPLPKDSEQDTLAQSCAGFVVGTLVERLKELDPGGSFSEVIPN